MSPDHRARFDALLAAEIDRLPDPFRRALDEVPVIVEDRPDPDLAAALQRDGLIDDPDDPEDDLLGLHSGDALTERSVEASGVLPGQIHLFRDSIVDQAGGFVGDDADRRVAEEIRVTLLHEIGHHFGLDEDDLDRLGYA